MNYTTTCASPPKLASPTVAQSGARGARGADCGVAGPCGPRAPRISAHVDNCEIATRHPAGCGGTRLAVVGGAVHGRITAGRKNAILARWLRSPHAEPHGGRLAGEGVGPTGASAAIVCGTAWRGVWACSAGMKTMPSLSVSHGKNHLSLARSRPP